VGTACDYGTEGSVAVPCPVRASRSRAAVGSVFGLIRLRSPTFIGVRINAAMQVADVNGIQRTIIPSPENRKVVGSPAAAFPSLSALRCGLDARAAQETYRSRKPQRSDQRVGKSGGHGNRFYPDPRRRDSGSPTRSLSTARSARISALVSMGISLPCLRSCGPTAAPGSRAATDREERRTGSPEAARR
jgi:hypothetical protein